MSLIFPNFKFILPNKMSPAKKIKNPATSKAGSRYKD